MEAGMSLRESGPTKPRAKCGTTNPTHPMTPESATLTAVVMVVNPMRTTLIAPGFSPSDRASSSPIERMLSFQRSTVITTRQGTITMAALRRSDHCTDASEPISQKTICGSFVDGSATYCAPATSDENRLPVTKPTSTRVTGDRSRPDRATSHVNDTATAPVAKAEACVTAALAPSRMATAAPRPAPEETPSTYGETSGL